MPVTPSASDPAAAERRRLARLFLAAVFGVVALFLLWAGVTQGWAFALVVAAFGLVVTAGGLFSVHNDRVRRARDFAMAFGGSLDAAAQSLDQDAIRALRDTRGELVAAREVRRRLPMLSLDQVARIVRSL
jgi:Flp pilus assembly protein TadB